MKLKLIRKWFSDKSTIGELYVDDQWECFTLEDVVRETKIPNETAIPEGKYRVITTYSERFKRVLPLLLDVPGFTGIRIHSGNDNSDTSGCILVGQTHGFDWIGQSRKAFDLLYAKIVTALKAGMEIEIEITHETET